MTVQSGTKQRAVRTSGRKPASHAVLHSDKFAERAVCRECSANTLEQSAAAFVATQKRYQEL